MIIITKRKSFFHTFLLTGTALGFLTFSGDGHAQNIVINPNPVIEKKDQSAGGDVVLEKSSSEEATVDSSPYDDQGAEEESPEEISEMDPAGAKEPEISESSLPEEGLEPSEAQNKNRVIIRKPSPQNKTSSSLSEITDQQVDSDLNEKDNVEEELAPQDTNLQDSSENSTKESDVASADENQAEKDKGAVTLADDVKPADAMKKTALKEQNAPLDISAGHGATADDLNKRMLSQFRKTDINKEKSVKVSQEAPPASSRPSNSLAVVDGTGDTFAGRPLIKATNKQIKIKPEPVLKDESKEPLTETKDLSLKNAESIIWNQDKRNFQIQKKTSHVLEVNTVAERPGIEEEPDYFPQGAQSVPADIDLIVQEEDKYIQASKVNDAPLLLSPSSQTKAQLEASLNASMPKEFRDDTPVKQEQQNLPVPAQKSKAVDDTESASLQAAVANEPPTQLQALKQENLTGFEPSQEKNAALSLEKQTQDIGNSQPYIEDLTLSQDIQNEGFTDSRQGAEFDALPIEEVRPANAEPVAAQAPSNAERVFWTPAPSVKRWQAEQGLALAEVLQEWTSDIGVELIWDTTDEFVVMRPFAADGTFETAIKDLLDDYNNSIKQPLATIFIDPVNGERTLVIQTRS